MYYTTIPSRMSGMCTELLTYIRGSHFRNYSIIPPHAHRTIMLNRQAHPVWKRPRCQRKKTAANLSGHHDYYYVLPSSLLLIISTIFSIITTTNTYYHATTMGLEGCTAQKLNVVRAWPLGLRGQGVGSAKRTPNPGPDPTLNPKP